VYVFLLCVCVCERLKMRSREYSSFRKMRIENKKLELRENCNADKCNVVWTVPGILFSLALVGNYFSAAVFVLIAMTHSSPQDFKTVH
jgi:hypothetical protein